jgi:hypothetical protein
MINVSKYFEPYTGTRATMRGQWTGTSGVYFIKRKGATKPVYIGSSNGSLKKTIYRHFQNWETDRQHQRDRTTYPKHGYIIKVIKTTPQQAAELEKIFIQRFQPAGNPIKYSLFNPKPERIKKILDKVKNADELEEAPF